MWINKKAYEALKKDFWEDHKQQRERILSLRRGFDSSCVEISVWHTKYLLEKRKTAKLQAYLQTLKRD